MLRRGVGARPGRALVALLPFLVELCWPQTHIDRQTDRQTSENITPLAEVITKQI